MNLTEELVKYRSVITEDAEPKPFPGASIYDSGEDESDSEEKDEKETDADLDEKEEKSDEDDDTKKPAKKEEPKAEKKEAKPAKKEDSSDDAPVKKEKKKGDKLEVYKQLRDAHDAAKDALYQHMKANTVKYKPEEEKVSIGKDHLKKLIKYALDK